MTSANTRDSLYMRRCLQLAHNGCYYVAPNPMVGAVLVDTHKDTIVSEGWHRRFGGPHAEVECFAAAESALANLSEEQKAAYYNTLTLYVSLEPCSHYGKTPPCADLIIRKHVARVVVGCLDPNPAVAGKGIQRIREAGIAVTIGVEEEACHALNKRFMCLYEQHRPYVILKWAQTADGFVDYQRNSGKPLVISSPLTKMYVHEKRAENMAIMVGTGTALLDNPSLLTTRWPGRNPIRIVVDRHQRIAPDAAIFSPLAPTITYTERTDWPFIVNDLGKRGIHSVLVEGGPTLHRHILQSGIWDEIHIEVADVRIGAGVKAPQIPLPTTFEAVGQSKLYCIKREKP